MLGKVRFFMIAGGAEVFWPFFALNSSTFYHLATVPLRLGWVGLGFDSYARLG